MAISKIEIFGLRGFGTKQELKLGINDTRPGSGLTVIVGPNNSGKSTIYEAFKALCQAAAPPITEGRRNKQAGEIVEIKVETNDNKSLILKTVSAKGSETEYVKNDLANDQISFFALPSRRSFNPFFSKSAQERQTYILNQQIPYVRSSDLTNFASRLFNIQKKQEDFNAVLKKVIDPVPSWYIEMADNGNHYLKFNYNGALHNSDGAGEGLLSIFTIVDALYDSNPNDLIYIDEPELSLHPSLKRKLLDLFMEYSSSRQIVISTHSPYFISWESLQNGGKIARTCREENGTKIYQLQDSTIREVVPLANDLNNPHILGLDAREIFFLDENIILVEGQEDVIFFKKIMQLKNTQLKGTFYGWGVGGADKTKKVLQMLKDLGFKKIVTILDNNKAPLKETLEQQFPEYKILVIPTDDVRDKNATNAKGAVRGLINSGGTVIDSQHNEAIDTFFTSVNSYFAPIQAVVSTPEIVPEQESSVQG